jgi:DNA-binding transcriptional MocR family regulator
MIVPPAFRDRCINAIRATGWMATPIMSEVVSRLINDGRIDEHIRSKRDTAAHRYAMARQILGDLTQLERFGGGFYDFASSGASQIKGLDRARA